jgi:hypothetical protein
LVVGFSKNCNGLPCGKVYTGKFRQGMDKLRFQQQEVSENLAKPSERIYEKPALPKKTIATKRL